MVVGLECLVEKVTFDQRPEEGNRGPQWTFRQGVVRQKLQGKGPEAGRSLHAGRGQEALGAWSRVTRGERARSEP